MRALCSRIQPWQQCIMCKARRNFASRLTQQKGYRLMRHHHDCDNE